MRRLAVILLLCFVFSMLTACNEECNTTGFTRSNDDLQSDNQFAVQYIRTNGVMEDCEYPDVKIIRSTDELNAYYDGNKDRYDLERKDTVYADSTIGFLDACDRYNDAYFEEKILIMVVLQEGSGSVRHSVDSVEFDSNTGQYAIHIRSIVPEVGTDDTAQWHILIEPETGITVANVEDVIVYLDGVNPKLQPTVVQELGVYSSITLAIPHDWQYETYRGIDTDDCYIAFWPDGETEGKLKVSYSDFFGICGTGLETQDITIGHYNAYACTYGNASLWEFIIFLDTPGSYVVINEGAEKWWSQYGEKAMEILSTVKIAERVITKAQAIEIVIKDVTVEYDQIDVRFDTDKGEWKVMFSMKDTLDGEQVFTITHEGKIINVEYGG